MQRIEIQNFGPIKDVAFDIRDYTVFIGPNASGKSTIAKAVYFFKSVQDELLNSFYSFRKESERKFDCEQFKKSLEEKIKAYWNSCFFCGNSKVTFYFDLEKKEYISFSDSKSSKTEIYLSEIIQQNFSNLNGEYQKQISSKANQEENPALQEAIFSWNFNALVVGFFSKNNHEYNYIPAGRSIFSSIRNELDPNSYPMISDFLVWVFIRSVNRIRRFFSDRTIPSLIDSIDVNAKNGKEISKKIDSLKSEILQGDYRNIEGEDFLEINGTKNKLPVNIASSGQQESIWILLYVLCCIISKPRSFTIIEEPEAHLFPESQEKMMHALTYFVNAKNNQLMLTTHSPYILTPLNNLLYAHTLGQDETKREQVAKIIDPDLWLDPNRFECYYVDKGEITSVVDRDVNMINLEKLDSASTIGNEEYDKLSELEG